MIKDDLDLIMEEFNPKVGTLKDNKDFKMNKFKQVFKSRTFWTLVVLFVVNGVASVHDFIPTSVLPSLEAVLGLATVYFHVNPSQNYNTN